MASYSYAGLQVRVSADTRPLTSQVRSASTSAGKEAGASLSRSVSSGLGSVAKTAGAAVGSALAVTAAVGAGFLGVAVKAGVAYNTLYQSSTKAFETILGSSKAATAMMGQLTAFAHTSPFPRQAFIQATQQMLAFGFSAKQVVPVLQAVQDAVAATGGSADDITGIVDILSKVRSSGKLTADTLDELGYRGVNAAQLIGKGMGMSEAAVRESITAGTLDSTKALDVLTQQMEIKFQGAAAGLKQTWLGTTDSIKGAMRDIGSAIVEPFISKQGGGLAIQWGNQLASVLWAIQPAVQPLVNALMQSLAPAFAVVNKGITTLLNKAQTFASGKGLDQATAAVKRFGAAGVIAVGGLSAIAGGALLSQLPLIGPIITGLLGPVTMLTKEIGKLAAGTVFKLVPGLGELFGFDAAEAAALGALSGPLLAVLAAVGLVIAASPKLRTALLGFGKALVSAFAPIIAGVVIGLKQVIPPVMQVARTIGDEFAPLVVRLTPLLVPLGRAVGTVLAIAFTELGFAMKIMMPVTQLVIAILRDLASWVLNGAVPAVTLLVTVVSDIIPVFRSVAAWVSSAARTIASAMSGAWSTVTSATGTATRWLTGNVSSAFHSVTGAASAAWAAVTHAVSSAWASVTSATTRTLGWIRGAVSSAFGAVVASASSAWRSVVSVVSGLLSSLASVVSSRTRAVAGAAASAWRSVVSVAASIWSGVAGAISRGLSGAAGAARAAGAAVIDAFRSGMAGAISGIGSWISSHILGPVRNALGGALRFVGLSASAPAVKAVPHGLPGRVVTMAGGGVVREPVAGIGTRTRQRYLFGEGGPERVSPLLSGGVTAEERAMLSAIGGGRGATLISVYPRASQSETQVAAAVDREWAWAAAGGGR